MKKHYLYTLITILIWGTSPLTIKKFLTFSWTGLQTITFAFLLGAFVLFLIALKQGKLSEIKTYKVKDFAIIFAIGSFGIFAYNMLNTYSYLFATSTEAAALNYLWPLWLIIFSMIILKEKITKLKILATILSFLGMLLVVTKGDFSSFANANFLGIAMAFLCSICYGLFSAITKKLQYDKTVSTMLYFLSGAIIGLICIALFSEFPKFTIETCGWLLLRGGGQFGIAYLLWTMALMGDTVKVSNLALVTPFVQLLLLALFMGEVIGIVPIIGLAFIVSGTLMARMRNK